MRRRCSELRRSWLGVSTFAPSLVRLAVGHWGPTCRFDAGAAGSVSAHWKASRPRDSPRDGGVSVVVWCWCLCLCFFLFLFFWFLLLLLFVVCCLLFVVIVIVVIVVIVVVVST